MALHHLPICNEECSLSDSSMRADSAAKMLPVPGDNNWLYCVSWFTYGLHGHNAQMTACITFVDMNKSTQTMDFA